MKTLQFKFRVRAAGWHLVAGIAMVGLVAAWATWAWFPYPFYWVSGGLGLFALIAAVDVALGPLLTFTVFNPTKHRSELVGDLAMVVTLQMAALAYGVWTLSAARPVYLVHEVDRFQVVTATDVRSQSDMRLPAGVHPPAWRGLQVIGVSESTTLEEKLRTIDLAMSGQDVALRAERWIPLNDAHLVEMKKRGHALTDFMARHPDLGKDVNQQLAKTLTPRNQIRVYPLIGRIDTWSVMFDLNQRVVVGYLPADGF